MGEYKQSTWREQRAVIRPGVHETIYFNDTNPNHILISNSGATPIFVGISAIADSQTYDMIIPGYGTRLYPRMQGTTRVYVYSDGAEDVVINVTSWEGEFDPASIPQSQEMVAGSADGLLGIIDINNFMQSLPPGDNYMGQVGIEGPLPAGENMLGTVKVSGAKDYTELLEDMKAALENSGGDYTDVLNTIYNNFGQLLAMIVQNTAGGGTGGGGYYPPSDGGESGYPSDGGTGGGSSIDYSDILYTIQSYLGELIEHTYSQSEIATHIETIFNDMIVPGEQYGSQYGIDVSKYKDLTVVVNSQSEKAGALKVTILAQSFGKWFSELEPYATYTITKPAGPMLHYLTKEEIPALGKPLPIMGVKIESLDTSFNDKETYMHLIGVTR